MAHDKISPNNKHMTALRIEILTLATKVMIILEESSIHNAFSSISFILIQMNRIFPHDPLMRHYICRQNDKLR